MSDRQVAIAANRFGLGPAPGEMDRIGRSPKDWLFAQLEGDRAQPDEFEGFLSAAELWDTFIYRYTRVLSMDAALKAAGEAGHDLVRNMVAGRKNDILYGWVTWVKENRIVEFGVRTNVALTTDEPFRERLVHFWSNHLVVPAGKQQSAVLLGAYEREAIRPYVTSKFSDMLLAAIKHPAMLGFLDNFRSIGPNSEFGRAQELGLNENLAREILELHTLGVEGGYTQEDVIELAKGITGWSMWPLGIDLETQRELAADPDRTRGEFHFYAHWHEPGPRVLLGKTYDQPGIAKGEAMLADLARHPNTARFLATKLARHFTVDEPPGEIVDRLAKAYLAHDTDLAKMTEALVETDLAWSTFGQKLKQPIDYIYSVRRALGLTINGGKVPPQTRYVFEDYPHEDSLWVWYFTDSYGLIEDRTRVRKSIRSPRQKAGFETLRLMADAHAMGQTPTIAPGPQGWYDRWSDWNDADSIMKRLEWAATTARESDNRAGDPRAFLNRVLGAAASSDLSKTVTRAATRAQGLALVLASPEFQRR